MKWIIILWLLLISLSTPFVAHAQGESKDYSITVFGAVMTDGALPESAFLTASFDKDFKFAAVAAAKKVGNLFARIDIELEGQVVKHLEGQHHWEFNALVVARWLRFPWNDIVKTTFAVGEGLSLAAETPAFEEKYHGAETNPLLNYLMFELDFTLPAHPRWSVVTRLHHRSGIYGFFNGVDGASNALALGIRYHF
jgi:hypothetical protein